jgi:hypothetical protein
MATYFERAWYRDINRAVSDYSTVLRLSASYVWYTKSFLKGEVGGATSGLWTCYSSCSGTAGDFGNGDLVDRLGATFDPTKWIRAAAGVAHTWIVLTRNFTINGVSTPVYCNLDFAGANDYVCLQKSYSLTAPSGGTVTNRPTAADEMAHTVIQLNNNTASASKMHGILSANGDFCVFSTRNSAGLAHTGILFNNYQPRRPDLDQFPFASFCGYGASGTGGFGQIGTVAGWRMRSHINGTTLTSVNATYLSLAGGAPALDAFPIAGDAQDLLNPDFPIIIAPSDSGHVSFRGRLIDLVWSGSARTQFDVEPNPGPPVSGVVGKLWLPLNAAPV